MADAPDTVQAPAPQMDAVKEEAPMEIHKPHAAKTWKEFFVELGTIVLGIVIAICLEQSVEYLHWRNEVKIARGALTEEIASVDRFYARRVLIAPCLDRRFKEDAARINDIAAKQTVKPRAFNPNSPGALLSDAEWQSERSSQTLTHFPRAELALMSKFYAQMADEREWLFEEEQSWSALAVMDEHPDDLGPADLAQLRVSLNTARTLDYLIALNAGRQLAISARLGIHYLTPGQDIFAPAIGRWCRPGEPTGKLPPERDSTNQETRS